MVGNRRQGWTIFGAMSLLFVIGVVVVYLAESSTDARRSTWRA